MRQALNRHPDSQCQAVTRIDVDVARPRARTLVLSYVVTSSQGGVRLPGPEAADRTDGLWRMTCFEAFIRAPGAAGYVEINLSPSTRWAAYRFSGYREGMSVPSKMAAPHIEMLTTKDGFTMQATVDLSSLHDLPRHASWRLGLSAVIEEVGGGLSYWALAHPPGKADFHHEACFSLEVPAPGRP